jgi:uncharacterized membrane protein YfcA
MSMWVVFGLFAAGFAGGFVDAIAGGGGLITVPALLAAGFPPQVALGTNKFQSCFGTAVAVWRYGKAGMLRTRGIWVGAVAALLAGAGGAAVVGAIDPGVLKLVVPWLLAGVAVYTALNRKFGVVEGRERMSPRVFALVFGLGIGFYDGFFGPGTGSFWTVALVGLLGLDLARATGYTKVVNLASNLGALGIFLMAGSVNFFAGGVMVAGHLLGARLGSGMVIRGGAAFIRPVFLTVVALMTAKLIWEAWWG